MLGRIAELSAMICGQGCEFVPFKKRTAIAFEIDEDMEVVKILRVFYGGQTMRRF